MVGGKDRAQVRENLGRESLQNNWVWNLVKRREEGGKRRFWGRTGVAGEKETDSAPTEKKRLFFTGGGGQGKGGEAISQKRRGGLCLRDRDHQRRREERYKWL